MSNDILRYANTMKQAKEILAQKAIRKSGRPNKGRMHFVRFLSRSGMSLKNAIATDNLIEELIHG